MKPTPNYPTETVEGIILMPIKTHPPGADKRIWSFSRFTAYDDSRYPRVVEADVEEGDRYAAYGGLLQFSDPDEIVGATTSFWTPGSGSPEHHVLRSRKPPAYGSPYLGWGYLDRVVEELLRHER